MSVTIFFDNVSTRLRPNNCQRWRLAAVVLRILIKIKKLKLTDRPTLFWSDGFFFIIRTCSKIIIFFCNPNEFVSSCVIGNTCYMYRAHKSELQKIKKQNQIISRSSFYGIYLPAHNHHAPPPPLLPRPSVDLYFDRYTHTSKICIYIRTHARARDTTRVWIFFTTDALRLMIL